MQQRRIPPTPVTAANSTQLCSVPSARVWQWPHEGATQAVPVSGTLMLTAPVCVRHHAVDPSSADPLPLTPQTRIAVRLTTILY